MIDNLLVSVIMPAYNSEKFIYESLKSVIDQTYSNIEIIIVDNNSTDNTVWIINSFNDPRISCFSIANDGIIARSRNFGIEKSKGQLVAFIDSDDQWARDKLERVIIEIQNGYDLVYHDLESVNTKNETISIIRGRKIGLFGFSNLVFRGNCIWNSSVTLKKNLFEKFGLLTENTGIIGGEDFHYWLRLVKGKVPFKYINCILGKYLVHEGASSNKINKKKLVEKIITDIEPGWMGTFYRALNRIRFYISEKKHLIQK